MLRGRGAARSSLILRLLSRPIPSTAPTRAAVVAGAEASSGAGGLSDCLSTSAQGTQMAEDPGDRQKAAAAMKATNDYKEEITSGVMILHV